MNVQVEQRKMDINLGVTSIQMVCMELVEIVIIESLKLSPKLLGSG